MKINLMNRKVNLKMREGENINNVFQKGLLLLAAWYVALGETRKQNHFKVSISNPNKPMQNFTHCEKAPEKPLRN